VIGGLAASELVHHLAGLGPSPTQGRALVLDLSTGGMTAQDVVPVPGCPRCGWD
jgi:hypothetical protein